MKAFCSFCFILLISTNLFSSNINIFGLGLYDVNFDGADTSQTIDFKYERRFDKTLIDIGPEDDNFFFLKPFVGLEYTGDNASYFLTGIYLEDNVGQLFQGKKNKWIFTPSLGFGYYDRGSGKKLGHEVQFRTTIEFSYELKNSNRLGLSLSHTSNANLGNKNPGVEVITLSYQVPY